MKIINVVGARPQFVKYFSVYNAIMKSNSGASSGIIKDVLVHTGQHYDYNMSKIFFDEFGIKEPEYHLGVGSGPHGEQTGRIIQEIEETLNIEKPDVVLVYGDTNSTLGAALAAVKLHVPVAHVEAGLRSFNMYMPEEVNRILSDNISTFLFCPSETAVANLRNSGYKGVLNNGKLVSSESFPLNDNDSKIGADKNNPLVINTGDVMYDALLYAVDVKENGADILNKLNLNGNEYSLLTIHRAETTDNPDKLREVAGFVNDMSAEIKVVFPMHPRMRSVYDGVNIKFCDNVKVVDPLGYFDLLKLAKSSVFVMTDSGGLQKEAYWLKTPCITLRDETEWIETVESGWNTLYKDCKGAPSRPVKSNDCYGDGKASDRIVATLKRNF